MTDDELQAIKDELGQLNGSGWNQKTQGHCLQCLGGAYSPKPIELLTDDEHKAIEMAGELFNLLGRITAYGDTRSADMTEACNQIHLIQHRVMAQAAARAYPDRYRLLGGVIAND